MRALLALLALALLGLGLFLYSSSPDGVSDGSPSLLPDGPSGPDSAALRDEAEAATGSADDASAPTSSARAQAPSTRESREHQIEVLVVDPDGQPVPGAEIFAMTATQIVELDRSEMDRMQRDRMGVIESHGERFVADRSGRAQIEYDTDALIITGRGPGLVGSFAGKPEVGETLRLQLAVDITLRVQVVDDAGAPAAGVHVLVQPDQDVAETYPHVLGRTGPDGLLEARSLQEYCPYRGRLRLSAGLFAPKGEPLVVDTDDLPEEDPVLRLPPSGSLRLQVVDGEGRPYRPTSDGEAFLSLASHAGPVPESRLLDRQVTCQLDENATVVLEHVQLDRQIAIFYQSLPGGRIVFAGPTRAERSMVKELAIDADKVVLKGRAHTEDGKPLSGAFLTARINGDRWGQGLRSDRDGRIQWGLNQVQPGKEIELTIDTKLTSTPLSYRTRLLTKAGVHDLGDLTFAAAPLIVGGRTLARGEMKSPPTVEVYRQKTPGDERSWVRIPGLEPALDPSDLSRFAIHGVLTEPGPYRLQVKGGGPGNDNPYLPVAPIPFVPGTDNLEVRLQRGGAVRARFQVEAETPWRAFLFRLENEAQDPAASQADWMSHQRGGWQLEQLDSGSIERTWNALRPGSYRLEVLAPGVAEPLIRLEGLEVRGGAPCDDPRLTDIDLRGGIGVLRLKLRDERGAPVTTAGYAAVPEGEGDAWQSFSIRGGEVLLPVADDLRLAIQVPGYRILEVDGIRADTELFLEKQEHVTLEFSDPGLPADSRVQVTLQWEDPQNRRLFGDAWGRSLGDLSQTHEVVDLSETRTCQLAVPARGAFQLVVFTMDHERLEVRPARLQLDADAPGTHRIELTRSPQAQKKD